MLPSPGSIYENLHKLPGGHYLEYRDGCMNITRHWLPVFNEDSDRSIENLGVDMREL